MTPTKSLTNFRPKTPIDGGWSSWTSWSSCQMNCRQQRNRTCDFPTPLFGGADCPGNWTELSSTLCYGDSCCPGNQHTKFLILQKYSYIADALDYVGCFDQENFVSTIYMTQNRDTMKPCYCIGYCLAKNASFAGIKRG